MCHPPPLACGCGSICAYVLPNHSIFLHTHLGKSGKCRLKPTQTATTSSILCRQHGPIWPKLERHVVSSLTCRNMSATFPAKIKAMHVPRAFHHSGWEILTEDEVWRLPNLVETKGRRQWVVCHWKAMAALQSHSEDSSL